MDKFSNPTSNALKKVRGKHWKNAFYWSLLFLGFWIIYFYLWQGYFNFGSFIAVLATTAAVMIATSFLFGTFTFYTDFLDKYLAYRKYFGLVGYWYLVTHVVLLTILNPQQYLLNPLQGEIDRNQALGLVALMILTFMMAISHETVMIKIGPKLWRNCLRLGYLIYPPLILRAFSLDYNLWQEWFYNSGSLLPPSLITSILAIFVILFRLSVFPARLLQSVSARKDRVVPSHDAHPQEPSHPDYLRPVSGPPKESD